MKNFNAHFVNKKSQLRVALAIALIMGLICIGSVRLVNADETQASAQKLLKAGKILPLEKIRALAKALKPGEILETELEHKKGMYIYEVEILDDRSQVWEIKLDAKTGRLIKMELDD